MCKYQFYRFIVVSLFLIFCIENSFGQLERNNIFIFDCTGSMKSNSLWEPAKSALYATITTQTAIPNSQFHVIPFGDKPYQSIFFNSNQYDNKNQIIESAFNRYIAQAKYTHISDALKTAFNNIDINKENKIYLLTDGLPNGGDSPENVAAVITEWCANHQNCRLFYVALTNGIINPIIRRAIDACPDAFIVQCEGKIIPQIVDISSDVYTSLEELNTPKLLSFSLPGKYTLDVNSNDSLFNISISDNSASNGKVLVSLMPKEGLNLTQLHQILQGNDHSFPFELQCADKKFFIANPIVTVHISDEIPSKLSLAQGEKELYSNGVRWYDSFLWNDAAEDKKIEWDLSPIFKNELQNSNLRVVFQKGDGQPNDFHAFYNKQLLELGDVIVIEPNKPALIEILFNHNAEAGKRYFKLSPYSFEGLDYINEKPSEDYVGTSLRTEYNIDWNPLKTFSFWLVIIIISAIILWMLIFKRIFFPTIKMNRIIILGPDSFYVSKKIKGARKILLTSKHKPQNFFSRIFTGEIRFIESNFFSPELTITPAGKKRKVKLSHKNISNNIWEIYPSLIFGQYDKGSIINRNTNKTSEIEFN